MAFYLVYYVFNQHLKPHSKDDGISHHKFESQKQVMAHTKLTSYKLRRMFKTLRPHEGVFVTRHQDKDPIPSCALVDIDEEDDRWALYDKWGNLLYPKRPDGQTLINCMRKNKNPDDYVSMLNWVRDNPFLRNIKALESNGNLLRMIIPHEIKKNITIQSVVKPKLQHRNSCTTDHFTYFAVKQQKIHIFNDIEEISAFLEVTPNDIKLAIIESSGLDSYTISRIKGVVQGQDDDHSD